MKTKELTAEILSWTFIVLTGIVLFFACNSPVITEPVNYDSLRVATNDSLKQALSDSLDKVSSTFTTLPIDSEMKVKEVFDSIKK